MNERSASRNLTTCQELNPGRYTGGGLLCGRPAKDGICASHAAGRKRAEAHQEKLAAKERHAHALADARDELVRAAVAWRGSVSSEERRLYEMELARKVAVYEKLAGGA